MHSHRKKMHPKEWLEQRLAKYGNRDAVIQATGQQSEQSSSVEFPADGITQMH